MTGRHRIEGLLRDLAPQVLGVRVRRYGQRRWRTTRRSGEIVLFGADSAYRHASEHGLGD